ncbi:hypothetical protein HX882_21550 [Pseudomonas gingeri]|uniref:Uncharacterized protein n=1 Tax=Pseudomonas gingeri TaxID=117681 RepID=A0A7Y7XGR5_9PSED|nr:hypothetical protein [Pseudomonas gingeri]NWB98488.1 hypothetical protein [Pseudomonas gingeri]
MIDVVTGLRVVVLVHEIYGPYVRVSSYEDGGAFEDALDDECHVPYWKKTPMELRAMGGNEYYFGWATDIEKLQEIIDGIVFNN